MRHLAPLLVLLVATSAMAQDDSERNLYEWSAVAPIVVAGTSRGEDGRNVDFTVLECLRGNLAPGDELRVNVRQANRDRDRSVHPKALHLDAGSDYVLLLTPIEDRDAGEPPGRYRLARGVSGARDLPLEGREAFLDALRTFIRIQGADGEEQRWTMLSRELEQGNGIVLDTALELFLKFHRGEPEIVPDLLPLLDHPQPEMREETARLIGQIVGRFWDAGTIPDSQTVRAELIARARRDDAVEVRMAATQALASFPAPLVDDVLAEIAASDPEQPVRYAAELIRLQHRNNDAAKSE